VCEVTLAAAEISPTGRDTGKLNPKYKGSVIMLGAPMEFPEEIPGFPVRDEELDSRPMDPDEVLAWYAERTDMQDRYRVMESLDGSGECVVRGHFVCTGKDDFAAPVKTVYQYSPYLLEALMQLVNFHIVMRDTSERRSMIPFAIGEMRFSRKAAPGERITLEARMSRRDAEGIVWNARASSASGETLMITRDLRMKWFPK
jgi:3-hydroxymyristoyl/3-hydroxydecanoyl-(acyl carrier protein) dehydratase